MYNYKTVMI